MTDKAVQLSSFKMIIVTNTGSHTLETKDGELYVDDVMIDMTKETKDGGIKDKYGNITWVDSKGAFHRDDDNPAVVCANGNKEWYQHGIRHRDNNKPASIDANGAEFWYQYGRLHRDDGGPTIVQNKDKPNMRLEWHQHGNRHRDNDLPSIIMGNDKASGLYMMYWHKDGKVHREGDKPAVMKYKDGKLVYTAFYLKDKMISELGNQVL